MKKLLLTLTICLLTVVPTFATTANVAYISNGETIGIVPIEYDSERDMNDQIEEIYMPEGYRINKKMGIQKNEDSIIVNVEEAINPAEDEFKEETDYYESDEEFADISFEDWKAGVRVEDLQPRMVEEPTEEVTEEPVELVQEDEELAEELVQDEELAEEPVEEEPVEESKNPKTGDGTEILLWLGLLVITGYSFIKLERNN